MSVNIHIICSHTRVHEVYTQPSQYYCTCATSIELYHHFWWWRFQILPQAGTEMPIFNFPSKPFLQCKDTFRGMPAHLVTTLCIAPCRLLVSVWQVQATTAATVSTHWDTGDLPQCTPGGNRDCTFPLPMSLRQEASALWCCSAATYLSKNLVILFSASTCSCRQQTWGNKEFVSDTLSTEFKDCQRLCPSSI